MEASVAAGVAASFRRRKASLQAAEAQRSACAAADSVQDCVALMLEDFRMMEHQPAWRLAVAPLLPDALAAAGGVAARDDTKPTSPAPDKPHSPRPRPRSAAPGHTLAGPADASGGGGGGGGRWGEVAALLLKQLEVGEPEHAAHRLTLLLRSEKQPDSLMVVASTVEAVGAVQRLKPNSLWHASSTHPLAQDAFAVLRSGGR